MAAHKYSELAKKLQTDIQAGVYSGGQKLPSENELAERTGYSRQTVRQAIGTLENQGLIVRVQGSGTYVKKLTPKRERTFNVAVVTTYIGEYIFPAILQGISQSLSERGFTPLLYATGNRVENERRILKELLNKPIDGLIVEGTKTAFPNPNIDLYNRFAELGIPVVFINGFYPDLKRAVYVVADDRAGGRMACELLLKNGHTRIAGIFKSDDAQGHFRYAGYTDALRHAGLAIEDDHVLWYTTENCDGVLGMCAEDTVRDCTAVVCYNDEIAMKLLKLMINSSEKIEMVSFDNSIMAQLSAVPFVSLSNSKEELGSLAAKKLVNILNGQLSHPSVLPWHVKSV